MTFSEFKKANWYRVTVLCNLYGSMWAAWQLYTTALEEVSCKD